MCHIRPKLCAWVTRGHNLHAHVGAVRSIEVGGPDYPLAASSAIQHTTCTLCAIYGVHRSSCKLCKTKASLAITLAASRLGSGPLSGEPILVDLTLWTSVHHSLHFSQAQGARNNPAAERAFICNRSEHWCVQLQRPRLTSVQIRAEIDRRIRCILGFVCLPGLLWSGLEASGSMCAASLPEVKHAATALYADALTGAWAGLRRLAVAALPLVGIDRAIALDGR